MLYSLIIPLYNRPDEIRELLETLVHQTYKQFEVLVIEDGSTLKAEEVIKDFAHQLTIKYFYKPNSGQGFTRNYGFEKANGDFFIILDSDVLLPKDYLSIIHQRISTENIDAFGTPDAAHPSFTPIQKAISYAMTSLFTTGGIRGKKKKIGTFHPRSFSMGISRKVWEKTKGFKITRMGEDLEFSIRLMNAGFKAVLIDETFVYHKRRTDFRRFFNQLQFFGRARVNVYTFFKEELKLVHLFPFFFTLYVGLLLLLLPFFKQFYLLYIPLALWKIGILVESSIQNKSIKVGFLSIIAAFIQLTAYGIGFIQEFFKRIILKKGNDVAEYPQ